MRVYNFSPGPSMLPLPVLEKAQREMTQAKGSGMSVMEMSHRSAVYEAIIAGAEASLRRLMQIPDNYRVLFIQGGATMQFSAVPLNLKQSGRADYVDSGNFAAAALKEGARWIAARCVASSKADNYAYVPALTKDMFDEHADYVHITTNNTIFGTRYPALPPIPEGVPLVADMSSNILSEPYDVRDFGVIYAGAQKNIGCAGLAIVIVREDLLSHTGDVPVLLDWNTYAKSGSMYNTPPTYAIYIAGLVLDWLEQRGGVDAIYAINRRKAAKLYAALDASAIFTPTARADCRSLMNVTFTLPTKELDARFVKEAEEAGLMNLKGHRIVGGMRASLYNAMPEEGVEALIAFMRAFEKTV